MIHNFETKNCPLCGAALEPEQRARAKTKFSVMVCPIKSTVHSKISHYEVEEHLLDAVQHIYIGDWAVDSFARAAISRLYKRIRDDGVDHNGEPNDEIKWELVKEIPMLKANSEQNMLDRINTLMTFL